MPLVVSLVTSEKLEQAQLEQGPSEEEQHLDPQGPVDEATQASWESLVKTSQVFWCPEMGSGRTWQKAVGP